MSRQVQGFGIWLWQRLSALYLGLFLIYFVASLLLAGQTAHPDWHAWVMHPFNSTVILVGFFMLVVHAWIGIRDVIFDYVKPLGLRAVVLMLFGLGLLGCLAWLLRVMVVAMMR